MATPTTKYRDLLALYDNVKAGDVAGDPERFAEALVQSHLPNGKRLPDVLLAHPNELRRVLARVFEAGRASMFPRRAGDGDDAAAFRAAYLAASRVDDKGGGK